MRVSMFHEVESWSNTILLCSSQEEENASSEIIKNCHSTKPKICLFNETPAVKEDFDAVVIVCSDEKVISSCLGAAFTLLKPNGKLYLYTRGIRESMSEKELSFAGFVNLENVGLVDDTVYLYCSRKPNFSVDHTALLNFPKTSKVWSLEDDTLIDDSTLLNEDDLKKPSTEDLKSECANASEKTRRRPCKNCTCGLAEELEQEKAVSTKVGVISSCGNCALGDAFRCSNCPYLGMPPFKTDEAGRIKLSDVTDA